MKKSTTKGWIDAASLTQVVQTCDRYPDMPHPGGWNLAQFVTSLLIGTRGAIGIAPGIRKTAIVGQGPIASLTLKLLDLGMSVTIPSHPLTQEMATRKVRNRVRRSHKVLRDRYDLLLRGSGSEVDAWMDWSLKNASKEHIQNFGSLIDNEWERELVQLTDFSRKDIQYIYKAASRHGYVSRLVRKWPSTDEFRLLYDGFLLSALLRGLYHYYAAKMNNRHLIPHPLRMVFLPTPRYRQKELGPSDVEYYLSRLIIYSACQERDLESRVLRWANNIHQIRQKQRPGWEEIRLGKREDPDVAVREAVRAAQAAGLGFSPRSIERLANAGIFLGENILSVFYWPLSIIGVLDYHTSRKQELGTRLLSTWYNRRQRLAKIATAPAGWLSSFRLKWFKTP